MIYDDDEPEIIVGKESEISKPELEETTFQVEQSGEKGYVKNDDEESETIGEPEPKAEGSEPKPGPEQAGEGGFIMMDYDDDDSKYYSYTEEEEKEVKAGIAALPAYLPPAIRDLYVYLIKFKGRYLAIRAGMHLGRYVDEEMKKEMIEEYEENLAMLEEVKKIFSGF